MVEFLSTDVNVKETGGKRPKAEKVGGHRKYLEDKSQLKKK